MNNKENSLSLRIVLTTGASDSHTWNLVYLQLLLEELGHHVHNLGACVPETLLVNECIRLGPDLVLFSSVNGHGSDDGLRAIAALREHRALAEIPVVIGGKLGIDGPSDIAPLLAAGFDAVFEDGSGMAKFYTFLGQMASRARV